MAAANNTSSVMDIEYDDMDGLMRASGIFHFAFIQMKEHLTGILTQQIIYMLYVENIRMFTF